MPAIEINPEILSRYDKAGPRYTSYPTAVQFTTDFTVDNYLQQIASSNQQANPLSLYFHIPFCDTVCFYCACNKIITNNRKRATPYLQRLHKEIAMQGALIDRQRTVTQLHWGGGTPTFISFEQMQALMDITREQFNLLDDDTGEYSIEIDPREADASTVTLLRKLGFNRMSLGVQDFDPQVQKAVNRIQSEQETEEVIQAARDTGFHSVSIDLIYGLPHQNVETFSRTLAKVIALDPQRVSVFNYAHLPEMFKTQRQIKTADLPTPELKLAILHQAIDQLTGAGYVYIGMDHFAKPDDELAIAQANGSLYRNFQGYSTHADCDLIGMGVTSIGKVANSYSQNMRGMDDYYNKIDNDQLAVFRGIVLNDDDLLRREIISQLMCHFRLDIAVIETNYTINFSEYFADTIKPLHSMQQDGLLTFDGSAIQVLPLGSLLIRNIAMVFDKYLSPHQQRFSKVI